MLIKKWKDDSILPILPEDGDAGAICFINGFRTLYDDDMYEHENLDEYELQPMERTQIRLGFATVIPEGHYAQLVSLNRRTRWRGLSVINSPMIIDANYRNEWVVNIINLSKEPITVIKGDRICEFILRQKVDFGFEVVTEF